MQAGLNKNISRVYTVLLIAGGYVIAPFLLAAVYNQPAADDYYTAVRDANTRFIPVLQDSYQHWSGRYFAVAVARINPLLFNSFTAYKWYAALLLLMFITAVFLLLKQVAGTHLTTKQVAALTALLCCVYFAAMPSAAEGFYWFSAAWVYQLANIMCLLLIAVMLKLLRAATRRSCVMYCACACVLCACINGCNEISLIITCIGVWLFTLQAYKARKKSAGYCLAVAIVCCTSAGVAGAPGNFERLNHQQEYAVSWLWTFTGGLSIAGVYTIQWLAQVFIASLLYVPFFGNVLAAKMASNGAWSCVSLKKTIIIFLSTFILLQLFTVWAAGGSNTGRIENVIYLYFLTGCFFILQLYLVKRAKNNAVEPRNALLINIAAVLFFFSLFDINNNISTAWIDVISGKAKRYDNELTARAQTTRKCGKDTCVVPPLSSLPKTIFFEDIKSTGDSTDIWVNRAYSAYFGAGYIVTSAPLRPIESNMETIKNFGKEVREEMFK